MIISPIEWMKRGEVGFSPTYHTPTSSEACDTTATEQNKEDRKNEFHATPPTSNTLNVLIPIPFVVKEHFDVAIFGLEERIRSTQDTEDFTDEENKKEVYDSDDRSTAKPTPINAVILPDLYLGWGNAKWTHTKRGILRNRLFAVLLTKLSFNYARRQKSEIENRSLLFR